MKKSTLGSDLEKQIKKLIVDAARVRTGGTTVLLSPKQMAKALNNKYPEASFETWRVRRSRYIHGHRIPSAAVLLQIINVFNTDVRVTRKAVAGLVKRSMGPFKRFEFARFLRRAYPKYSVINYIGRLYQYETERSSPTALMLLLILKVSQDACDHAVPYMTDTDLRLIRPLL